jgi:hypothetical protein
MNAVQRPSALRISSPLSISAPQQEALRLLRQASDAASAQACNVWQFAVEIAQLYAVGLSNTDLRQLLDLGYLNHACEHTTVRSKERIFLPLDNLMLPDRTCFVLTSKGREVATGLHAENGLSVMVPTETPSAVNGSGKRVPRWDSDSRRLWWQDCLIKEFRRPAVNQETILSALEEDGWPPRIDDPLPQTPGIDPKVRLHDTIKSLNRHHLHAILCFRGDGSGAGVGWVIVGEGERSSPDRP